MDYWNGILDYWNGILDYWNGIFVARDSVYRSAGHAHSWDGKGRQPAATRLAKLNRKSSLSLVPRLYPRTQTNCNVKRGLSTRVKPGNEANARSQTTSYVAVAA